MSLYREAMDVAGKLVDGIGVAVVLLGAIAAVLRLLRQHLPDSRQRFRCFRQDLGRAILLGLEFLIAGDIIRTVVLAPSLENALILGMIVLIRTFLSVALQLEIEGRWPWQAQGEAPPR